MSIAINNDCADAETYLARLISLMLAITINNDCADADAEAYLAT